MGPDLAVKNTHVSKRRCCVSRNLRKVREALEQTRSSWPGQNSPLFLTASMLFAARADNHLAAGHSDPTCASTPRSRSRHLDDSHCFHALKQPNRSVWQRMTRRRNASPSSELAAPGIQFLLGYQENLTEMWKPEGTEDRKGKGLVSVQQTIGKQGLMG